MFGKLIKDRFIANNRWLKHDYFISSVIILYSFIESMFPSVNAKDEPKPKPKDK